MTNTSKRHKLDDYSYTILEVADNRVPFGDLEKTLRDLQPNANISSESRKVYCSGVQDGQTIALTFTSKDVIVPQSQERKEEIEVHITGTLRYRPRKVVDEEEP